MVSGNVETLQYRSVTGDHIMYLVEIQWGEKRIAHTAWSKSSALQWLYSYPKKDLFGIVFDIIGRTVATRYYR